MSFIGQLLTVLGLMVSIVNGHIFQIVHPWSFNMPQKDLDRYNFIHCVGYILTLLFCIVGLGLVISGCAFTMKGGGLPQW
jgi:hypothetical protein